MPSKQPLIAGSADGWTRDGSGKFRFGGGVVLPSLVGTVQDDFDLLHLEPSKAHFEIDLDKGLQLHREKLAVPSGLCGCRR